MKQIKQEQNNRTTTANGMATYKSTLDSCLDYFSVVGSLRGADLSSQFQKAYNENIDLANRILLYGRDCRGGQGQRESFRKVLRYYAIKYPNECRKLMHKIPEMGRWDDVLVLIGTPLEKEAMGMVFAALDQKNGLAAKWLPAQGVIAAKLRASVGMSPKQWRKTLVGMRSTVEQLMCSGQWDKIKYDHVPSLAAARYQKAFQRHDPVGYAKYIEGLSKGTRTVHATTLYPYDVLKSVVQGNAAVADAQWKALPNYLEGSNENILQVIDVSSSMTTKIPGNKTLSCMDISVSLGLYIAERMGGHFKNKVITFSEAPSVVTLRNSGTISERINELKKISWGGNTNLEAVFDLVLNEAVRFKIRQADMPTKILIISDMEFDRTKGSNRTAFNMIRQKFTAAGYVMPDVVFWNVNVDNKNNKPVRVHDTGTALVSGFSPSILKALLKFNMNDMESVQMSPYEVMLEAVMADRYKLD